MDDKIISNPFWKSWNSISSLEKKAIPVLTSGVNLVIKSIPKEDVVSIYIKWIFIRREMNICSDVDLVMILRSSKLIPDIIKLNDQIKNSFIPKLEIKAYILWELRTGKRHKLISALTPPSAFVNHLPYLKCIFGKTLIPSDFFNPKPRDSFIALLKTFNDYFLPTYHKGFIGFKEIVKQVIWLTERE